MAMFHIEATLPPWVPDWRWQGVNLQLTYNGHVLWTRSTLLLLSALGVVYYRSMMCRWKRYTPTPCVSIKGEGRYSILQEENNVVKILPVAPFFLEEEMYLIDLWCGEGGGIGSSLLPVSHQDLSVCRELASSASRCGVSSQRQALWRCGEGGELVDKIVRSPCGQTPKPIQLLLVIKMIFCSPYICPCV